MPQEYKLPVNDGEVKKRAELFLDDDPFPSIPRALLSSAEIFEYARVTRMLCPFYKNSLKSASL